MRSFFSLFSVFLLLGVFFTFSSWGSSDHAVFASSLSWVHVQKLTEHSYRIDASLTFDSPRTALYFSFPRSDAFLHAETRILWHTNSGDISRELDTDDLDMIHYDTQIFSTPWITRSRRTVDFSIISSLPLDVAEIALMSSYSDGSAYPQKIMPSDTAYAGTRIVSRAEWWADESYRYAESPTQKSVFQEYLHYQQSPKTEKQLADIDINMTRRQELERLFPDTEKYTSVKRTENGHRLVWPIEKVRQVNRIIIHHTAENIEDTEASDAVFLRDIYKYHAITRGWWDIGYNYIIGQRGAIYEGRAGGDYVIAGHTPGNNEWSVSISVIGDFEKIHLNRDQRAGLENAIVSVAEKYGITLSGQEEAITACKYTVDCKKIETHKVNALAGHRDYNATDCPWMNIYSEIAWWITQLDQKHPPIYNTEITSIEPFSSDELMNMTLIPSTSGVASIMSSILVPKKTESHSPHIKIRLSYTGSIVQIEWATVNPAALRMWLRKIPFSQGARAEVELSGKNQLLLHLGNRSYTGAIFSLEWAVVRIPSWNRIPDWDKSRKYNDNLFRGKIIIRNENGKLLIVNELPIEDYLKWMGEVSNTDLPEKIKTIIVSARSYAYYYMNKEHRKYRTLLYDGSDNPDEFQKYLGYGYEMRSPNVVDLVDLTVGQVIKYHWEITKTWYFSSSDGHTRSYLEYCESSGGKNCMNVAYLQSVEDPGWVWKVRNGHGVGISGIGATYFASQWWDYKKIIQYYMNGVEIMKK